MKTIIVGARRGPRRRREGGRQVGGGTRRSRDRENHENDTYVCNTSSPANGRHYGNNIITNNNNRRVWVITGGFFTFIFFLSNARVRARFNRLRYFLAFLPAPTKLWRQSCHNQSGEGKKPEDCSLYTIRSLLKIPRLTQLDLDIETGSSSKEEECVSRVHLNSFRTVQNLNEMIEHDDILYSGIFFFLQYQLQFTRFHFFVHKLRTNLFCKSTVSNYCGYCKSQ